jgi:hypothetical protein
LRAFVDGDAIDDDVSARGEVEGGEVGKPARRIATIAEDDQQVAASRLGIAQHDRRQRRVEQAGAAVRLQRGDHRRQRLAIGRPCRGGRDHVVERDQRRALVGTQCLERGTRPILLPGGVRPTTPAASRVRPLRASSAPSARWPLGAYGKAPKAAR